MKITKRLTNQLRKLPEKDRCTALQIAVMVVGIENARKLKKEKVARQQATTWSEIREGLKIFTESRRGRKNSVPPPPKLLET